MEQIYLKTAPKLQNSFTYVTRSQVMEGADPEDRAPGESEAGALRDRRSRHDQPLERETAEAGAVQARGCGRIVPVGT